MAGELYLIRHGQASFMQDNYDRLSALGRRQANILGNYLAHHHFSFEACYGGSLDRHQSTYLEMKDGYQKSGKVLAELYTNQSLNEHQAAEIHQAFLPELLGKPENHKLKLLAEEKGKTAPEVKKGFLRLFFKSTKDWMHGTIQIEGFEPYEVFKKRVEEAYELLQQAMEKHTSVLVVSSGGTIAMLMGILLGISDEKVIELNWQIRNCSITEFSHSKGKFYLRGFNQVAHFDENKQDLITYV